MSLWKKLLGKKKKKEEEEGKEGGGVEQMHEKGDHILISLCLSLSNFLRRGGSPNTAKQSPTSNAVKFGFGMIHALIVTKAPGALDLLLQQGANPNVFSLAQIDDDRVRQMTVEGCD